MRVRLLCCLKESAHESTTDRGNQANVVNSCKQRVRKINSQNLRHFRLRAKQNFTTVAQPQRKRICYKNVSTTETETMNHSPKHTAMIKTQLANNSTILSHTCLLLFKAPADNSHAKRLPARLDERNTFPIRRSLRRTRRRIQVLPRVNSHSQPNPPRGPSPSIATPTDLFRCTQPVQQQLQDSSRSQNRKSIPPKTSTAYE